MTRNKKRIRVIYLEEQINEAKKLVEEGMSIRAASRTTNIPESTLRFKLSGKSPYATRYGPKPILTDAEERLILDYIVNASNKDKPITKNSIFEAVYAILNKKKRSSRNYLKGREDGNTLQLSEKWWRSFKARNARTLRLYLGKKYKKGNNKIWIT